MKLKRFRSEWLIGLIIVIAMGYFLISLAPPLKVRFMNESLAQTKTTTRPRYLTSGEVPEKAKPTQYINDFAKKFYECLHLDLITDFSDPTELLQSLKVTYGVREEHVTIENYHIVLPNGEERRVHLRPTDQENAHGVELLFFSLDEDKLPVRIPLSPAQTLNPAPGFVSQLLGQGEMQFHQKYETFIFENGFLSEIELVDQRVHDIQVFTPGRSFNCRNDNCQCL